MILVVCVDDLWGMSFNGRRQSRDKVQRRDLVTLTDGAPLWMNEYSARLYRADGYLLEEDPEGADYKETNLHPDIRVSEDFLKEAGRGEYALLETGDITDYMDRVEAVIVYKWGRQYASDEIFPKKVLKKFKITGSETFKGSSHETISVVRYKR